MRFKSLIYSVHAALCARFGAAGSRMLGWLFVDKCVRMALNAGVGFVIARHLGPLGFGEWSQALAVVAMGAPVVEFGLEGYLRRRFFDRPIDAGKTAGDAMLVRATLAAVTVVVVAVRLLVGRWVGGLGPGGLLLLVSLTLFQPALTVPELWLMTRGDARTIVIWQWAVLWVGAITKLAIVYFGGGVMSFAGVLAVETILAGLLTWWAAKRRGLQVRWTWPPGWRMHLSQGGALVGASLAAVVYTRADMVWLAHVRGDAEAGLYAAAVRLSELAYFLPGLISVSFLPELLRARQASLMDYDLKLQAWFDLMVGVSLLIVVPLVLLSHWLVVALFGSAFAGAAMALAIHACALPFVFVGVARGQYLLNEGLLGQYLGCTLFGAAVGLAVNGFAVSRWGLHGAALSVVAGQAASAWLSSFLYKSTRRVGRMQTQALLLPVRYFSKLLPPTP